MNSFLYTAIYNSRKRLEPAIIKQRRENPLKERLLKFIRVLSPLQDIPISIDKKYTYFLDGNISKNSKTGKVYQELIETGVASEAIWHKSLKKLSLFDKLLRVIVRLPKLIVVLHKKKEKLKSLDLVALQVFNGYVAYKDFFRKHDKLVPIIISDLSPTLHMQWSAAKAVKSKVFWWQDDYHHFKGFSAENYFPYPCYYAAVLNEHGFETVRQNSPKTKIYKRKSIKINELQNIPDFPKVGIATSAFFEGKGTQFEMINCLRKQVGASSITFRLHPNSKIDTTRTYPEWLKFANQKEALEDFAKRIDIAIVGNSAVQLKLLCEGIPVVHISGLDPSEFDLYGYCKMGFIYGIPKNTDSISLCKIKTFYQNKDFKERIHKYVNVKTDLPELKELII